MISIVMAYYNRLEQFKNTLDSILMGTIREDTELVIVDDASKESERLDEFVWDMEWIKLIRIEPKNKCWVNPCIPYNIGFNKAIGDKIIIQNPECSHIGDIVGYVENNLTDQNYLTFSCKAFDQSGRFKMWYNHPTINPTNLHFCSAITKKNLDLLGGFDERYADGMCYDDNEFLHRVKRLGLKIECIEIPYVKHQWHSKEEHLKNPKYKELNARNKAIFETLTMKES